MGLLLFFLPNFPGATFIQGATFIPDSRVLWQYTHQNFDRPRLTFCLITMHSAAAAIYGKKFFLDFMLIFDKFRLF